ncbi:hypothetical protein EZV62_027730 [Acer yangbiense]|uniref:RNase H type-1 domain-containing protein n=1 Tax=Acer yangbiense TaxID=1000413 RepID=A0A5C7GWH2_9ROSI|nr:hypothetical protein EZV62_027730 [Acer yangbiense]
MDTDELERLCSALSIQELEGPVRSLDKGMKTRRERKLGFCLVGKVITKMLVNKDAFIRVFNMIWKVSEGVDIEWVEGNIFTFQFFNLEDRDRIINGGPWNFDKAIVVLEKMPIDGDITNLKFNKVDFWIQVHKIPPLCMSEEIGLFLGKQIGEVKEVDLATAREVSCRYLRIRCRRIGHCIRECPMEGDIREFTSEANYRLCMWLRTGSPPKRARNWSGRQENVTRGNSMWMNSAKEFQPIQRRFQDNWRSSKGSPYGNSIEWKGLSSTGCEKMKGPLIAQGNCMESCMESRGSVGKTKPREEESREENNGATMCIDSGDNKGEGQKVGTVGGSGKNNHNGKSIGKDQGQEVTNSNKQEEETRIHGSGQNKNGKQIWKRFNRTSSLLNSQSLIGIELGKRLVEASVTDLKELKKKARVNKLSDQSKQGKIHEGERRNEENQGIKKSVANGVDTEGKEDEREESVSGSEAVGMVHEVKSNESLAAIVTYKQILEAAIDAVWWSRNYIDEFHRANCKGKKEVDKEDKRRAEVNERWRPLDQGWLKVNCNARVDKRRRRIGFGFIIRNESGRVLACYAQSCEASYEVDCAKAMVVYKGLMFCKEIGVEKFIVETDLDYVINQIGTGGSSDSRYGGILDSIQSLISNSRTVSFRCVSDKANMVAWILAGEAVGFMDRIVWKEVMPRCIMALVEEEQRI